jgi:hypothetical protein
MARIGLRMMPTFPSSPLSFRTVSFPQYGWKAGLSGSAFPPTPSVKPAPGIPGAMAGLRLPFVPHLAPPSVPPCVGSEASAAHRHARRSLLYPRGPRSGLGYHVPVHPRLAGLIRPTRGHSATSPRRGLYALPSLCGCAEATPELFRAFAGRSCSACRPLRPRGVHRLPLPSSFADDAGLRRAKNGSALPSVPIIRFRWDP